MADGLIARARKLLVPGNAPNDLQDAPVVEPDRDEVMRKQLETGGSWPRYVLFRTGWEYVNDDGKPVADQSMVKPSRRV